MYMDWVVTVHSCSQGLQHCQLACGDLVAYVLGVRKYIVQSANSALMTANKVHTFNDKQNDTLPLTCAVHM